MLLFLICLEILDCLKHKGNTTADNFFFRSSFMPLKVNTTEKTNEYIVYYDFWIQRHQSNRIDAFFNTKKFKKERFDIEKNQEQSVSIRQFRSDR